MDFRALKTLFPRRPQVFSRDRWCWSGKRVVFVDPLYSPGSDFIGIANGFCCDLIGRDLDGATSTNSRPSTTSPSAPWPGPSC